MIRSMGLVIPALALAACTPSEKMRSQWAAAQAQQEMQLASAGERWRTLYQAGEWEALRSLYADDAVLMTQGQPKIEGADNIIAFLQRVPKAGGTVQFQFKNEEVVADAAYANPVYGVVTAKYLMTITFPGQEPIEVAGRSLLIYKWQEGKWLLWRDIDNLAPDAKPEDFAG